MSEDVIKVEIDDSELDMAIAKAKQLIAIGATAPALQLGTKSPQKLMSEWRGLERSWSQLTSDIPQALRNFGEADLPSVNRELRLILGQIPGVRILINDYFRLKRIQRSIGVAVDESRMLRDVLSNPQFVLTMVATMILILKSIMTYFEKLKRERLLYEEFLRRERGLSKREFDMIRTQAGGKSNAGAGIIFQHYWGNPE